MKFGEQMAAASAPPPPPSALPTAAQAVGLTSAEVAALRAKNGPNEVVQEGTPAWLRLCVLRAGARVGAASPLVARARPDSRPRPARPPLPARAG